MDSSPPASRSSTTQRPDPLQLHSNAIPYLNEKGCLDFSPDDIENPKNWSNAKRWYITSVGMLLVLNATMASSSPSAALKGVVDDFNVSEVAAGLVVTLFLLGYCFGPLFFAPLSEYYGRRWILYITFTGYLIFNFLCAFAPNFGSLLVGRFLTGSFASAPQTNVPGILADLWGPLERGNAMALFCSVVFVGPALGPVLSGFFQLRENWRWNYYMLIWLAAVSAVLMMSIPETYAPKILLGKARRMRANATNQEHRDVLTKEEMEGKTLTKIFTIALTRPWQILFDPIAFLVTVYLSVVYALLYMLFTIYPIVFQEKRGWNTGVGQLPLLGIIVGSAFGGWIVHLLSAREKRQLLSLGSIRPEERLISAMLGGILFSVSMFWLAWTGEFNSIHWIVPTLAGTFLAASLNLIFVGFLNYITDTYLMYTASAMAANTICRSACAAAAPLFTAQMFRRLGVAGGGSLVGGFAALLAPIPFLFYFYGRQIRQRSKFAPTAPKTEKTVTA